MSKHRLVPILSAVGVFLVAAVAPQVHGAMLISNNFDTDPGWTGVNNTGSDNNYGYSSGTSFAGASPGEVGGTFGRVAPASFYADTANFIGSPFTLGDALQASGKFDARNVVTMDNGVQIGFLSANTSDRSYMSLIVAESGNSTQVRIGAGITLSDGSVAQSALAFIPVNSDYWFDFSYNPVGGAFSSGQITLTVTNATPYTQTFTADLTSAQRSIGAVFDAFGIGENQAPGVANKLGDVFIDDVTYTVPEPTSLALLGLGALLWLRRRS